MVVPLFGAGGDAGTEGLLVGEDASDEEGLGLPSPVAVGASAAHPAARAATRSRTAHVGAMARLSVPLVPVVPVLTLRAGDDRVRAPVVA